MRTREREKELVLGKIKRSGTISMAQLTMSFCGRIHGIRELVDELLVDKSVIGKLKQGKHGPPALILEDGTAEHEKHFFDEFKKKT